MAKYGFIGCGNMGGALARAVARQVQADCVYLADMDIAKAQAIASETGAVVSDVNEITSGCDYIFIGVKPQGLEALAEQIRPAFAARSGRFVPVSMCAGTPIARLRGLLGDIPVIRIMPNLAASVGEGVIMYCSEGTTADEIAAFRGALAGAGILFPIGEELIDAGTALSGCAPAYAFMFAEALAEGGVRCGLSPEDASVLAAQTMLGAAKMIQESTQTPHELTVAVCSPGGMTIEGVQYLEASTFAEDTAMAVVKAWEKAAKL